MITRDELIHICDLGTRVYFKDWYNRDSPEAMIQLGKAWALLKSGCPFKILTKGSLKTDDQTIWLEITWPGFSAMEDAECEWEIDTFYLPTMDRLQKVREGKDWY